MFEFIMDIIKPVSEEELSFINSKLAQVNVCVSMSMAYIRRIQGWEFTDLEARFPAVPISMWKRYLQPSYSKMRPLHIVAAYSWLTMVPMPSFYRGLEIKEGYRGMDEASVEAMIHCGILPKLQFRILLDHLYAYLTDSQQGKVDHFIQNTRREYGSLDQYENDQFLFPKTLDIEAFAFDYYQSVAIAFQQFREDNKLKLETVANVLNLSLHRYKQCEDPENPVPLPVDIAARLKLGFQLTDAMPFTSHMKRYPQFHTVRLVQHIRETKLVELMRHIPNKNKSKFVTIINNMAQIYSSSLKD